MSDNYSTNYFDSIYEGLNKTKFFSGAEQLSSELLFSSINDLLNDLSKKKNKIFFFGNGASAAFANHMALDFAKNGKVLSKSLSDSAMLTALSNDYSYEQAMVEFLKIEGISIDDFVITISSSGNSSNIINVLKYCRENHIKTLALSGLKNNNKSLSLSDYSIYVPMKTYGMVECIHQIFLHLILYQFMEIQEWNRKSVQNMNASSFKL